MRRFPHGRAGSSVPRRPAERELVRRTSRDNTELTSTRTSTVPEPPFVRFNLYSWHSQWFHSVRTSAGNTTGKRRLQAIPLWLFLLRASCPPLSHKLRAPPGDPCILHPHELLHTSQWREASTKGIVLAETVPVPHLNLECVSRVNVGKLKALIKRRTQRLSNYSSFSPLSLCAFYVFVLQHGPRHRACACHNLFVFLSTLASNIPRW
jgi:hypothetical protein